jgi:hypothetical protein
MKRNKKVNKKGAKSKKMEEEKILDLVYENQEEWTDEQIGKFVRRALTEDINQYDLEKDMGLNMRRGA